MAGPSPRLRRRDMPSLALAALNAIPAPALDSEVGRLSLSALLHLIRLLLSFLFTASLLP